jgi:hypothetical protein
MRRLCVLLLAATVAAGCGGGSTGSSAPGSSAPGSSAPGTAAAQPLTAGKDLVPLEPGTYRSPDGFVPAVTVDVASGWSSSHRFDDAFDVTQPDPARDAPGVAVVWMTPSAPTAAKALEAVRSAAGVASRPVRGQVGTAEVAGLDIIDGTGEVVASARGGIALDAAKGQRIRVLAVDLGGKPLVVVILVPVAANWDALLAKALPLVESVRPA